jgi:tetratricopeptide (TPR) repeat protein
VRDRILAVAFTAVLAQSVSAQQSHSSHQIPVVPAERLEQPVELRQGIGSTHETVTTSSPEAQKFYDQGLASLHHFNWIEAARSFNQTLRLDPDVALAHVGLSQAYVGLNQSGAGRRALARAGELARTLSEHERQHVAIRQRHQAAADAPQDPGRLAAYRSALDEAIARFPSDVELWLERGIAESPNVADGGQGSTAGSVRFYNRALELVRDHFAAHHYLTHAYENSGRIQDALAHGAAYARLAPDVPHARHMHGHNLRRVGRIREAIAEFEAADRLQTAYFAAEGIRPEYDWHYEHNLDLLGTSYQYAGRIAEAERLLKAAFALPTANLVQAVNKRAWPVLLRARGRTDEALAAARILIGHPHPVVQAIGHIESGYAHLMKRQFAEAAAAANRALAAMKASAGRDEKSAGLAVLPFEGLQGEFYLRTGPREKGRALLEGMVTKARGTTGPDEWSQALFTLEATARSAREAGDWELAGRLARQMLEHDSSYAGTHYALALVADHDGDRLAADAAFALAERYWSSADPDLPELREIRMKK